MYYCLLCKFYFVLLFFLLSLFFCNKKTDRVPICEQDEMPCADGSRCVSLSARCDSIYQCPDKSDELGCQRTFLIWFYLFTYLPTHLVQN